jgi:predicted 2-oxoglutarate/Fe(II)-dependent dioxygenase YbiX
LAPMAQAHENALPFFQPFATAQGFLTASQMDHLIAEHRPLLSEGRLGPGNTNSRPEDYEGGDLELMYGNQPQTMDKARGAFIAFPSFLLHRVTPVTRGTRWSLVAWILGPRWR